MVAELFDVRDTNLWTQKSQARTPEWLLSGTVNGYVFLLRVLLDPACQQGSQQNVIQFGSHFKISHVTSKGILININTVESL